MSSDFICRTCLQLNNRDTCTNIEEVGQHSDILEMLSYSIPEMNMYLVTNPVICDNCVRLLQKVYKFKTQCLKVEECLLKFAQAANETSITLSEYCKSEATHVGPRNNNNDKAFNLSTIKQNTENRKQSKSKKQKKKIVTHSNKISGEDCRGCQIQSKDPCYHLKTNYPPFICYHCNKQSERIIDLRRHVLSHVKQRKCKLCGKRFRDLTVLKRHLWSHTGAKSFACNLCPKRFQQKHCLDQHLFKHQGNDKIKCSYCQKLFSTKYNAKVHMQTMHKKRELCDLCGERFMSKPELVKHLETNSKSCGKVIKTEPQNDIDNTEDFPVKVEPEFISIETSLNMTHKIKTEPLITDTDPLNFIYKRENLDEEATGAITKQESI